MIRQLSKQQSYIEQAEAAQAKKKDMLIVKETAETGAVCVCVCVCVRACVRACVHGVRVCVCVGQYRAVQYSGVQYNTVQCSAVYSTVQYSVVQYSTIEYSTVHQYTPV